MDSNSDAVERIYHSTARHLLVVEEALGEWEGRDAPKDKGPIEAFEKFVSTVEFRSSSSHI